MKRTNSTIEQAIACTLKEEQVDLSSLPNGGLLTRLVDVLAEAESLDVCLLKAMRRAYDKHQQSKPKDETE